MVRAIRFSASPFPASYHDPAAGEREGANASTRASKCLPRRPCFDFSAAFARVEIESAPQLLAHELLPLGTLHAVEHGGSVHTLRYPILSNLAARAFFLGQRSALSLYLSENHHNVSIRSSLLRRYGGVSDA